MAEILNSNIHVILVDDHEMWRQAFALLLKTILPNMVVSGEASEGEEFLNLLSSTKVDLAFLDIEMKKGMDGLEALKLARANYPDIKIIMCSQHSDDDLIDFAFKNGAKGYLIKDNAEDIAVVIQKALEDVDTHELAKAKAMEINNKCRQALAERYTLNSTEISVLRLLCRGVSNKLISDNLHISQRTVERHKTSIYVKTKTTSIADMISFGLRHGLS